MSLQATDSTFGAKLRENLHSNGRFKFDPKKPTDDFIVQHYAGPVTYSCTKFLDKNKDTLSPGKLAHQLTYTYPPICFCCMPHCLSCIVATVSEMMATACMAYKITASRMRNFIHDEEPQSDHVQMLFAACEGQVAVNSVTEQVREHLQFRLPVASCWL